MKWAKLLKYGMLLSSNDAFCTFFFWILNFEFWPKSAVLESTGFTWYYSSLSSIGVSRLEKKKKKKKPNARAAASLAHRHIALRRTWVWLLWRCVHAFQYYNYGVGDLGFIFLDLGILEIGLFGFGCLGVREILSHSKF